MRARMLSGVLAAIAASLPLSLGGAQLVEPSSKHMDDSARRGGGGKGKGRGRPARAYRATTSHVDHQRQASLRRRMGGNAMRIRMAREGRVFDDVNDRWVESPSVLPEEVEVLAARLRESASPEFDPPDCAYSRSIRGHQVTVWPWMLGPVRYQLQS